MSDFIWTDELVLLIADLAHHNGYHKLNQRVVELFDEVKKQASGAGYKFPQWILDHTHRPQPEATLLKTTATGKHIYKFPSEEKIYGVDSKEAMDEVDKEEGPSIPISPRICDEYDAEKRREKITELLSTKVRR